MQVRSGHEKHQISDNTLTEVFRYDTQTRDLSLGHCGILAESFTNMCLHTHLNNKNTSDQYLNFLQ